MSINNVPFLISRTNLAFYDRRDVHTRGRVEELVLTGLTLKEVVEWLNELNLPHNAPAEEIYSATGGHPLAVELLEIYGNTLHQDWLRFLDEEILNVKQAISNGFNCFKIKIGSSNNYKYDLERCTKIISSVDSSCIFSADANEGYTNEDALNFALEAKNCGLKFFEQPIPSKDLDFMNIITTKSSVPICSDEGVHSKKDIDDIINNRTSNGVSLKTIKLGGIVDVLNCAIFANENNISVNLAGKVAETSISSYAIANIATSIPQMNWDLSITNQYLIEDPVLEPLNIKDGKVFIKETIGLGTEIDMNKAKKYITQN